MIFIYVLRRLNFYEEKNYKMIHLNKIKYILKTKILSSKVQGYFKNGCLLDRNRIRFVTFIRKVKGFDFLDKIVDILSIYCIFKYIYIFQKKIVK